MERRLRSLAVAVAILALSAPGAKVGDLDEQWTVDSSNSCDGKQIAYERCYDSTCPEACTPEDCQFGPWNDWSSSDCTGLCERQRAVVQHNNECGKPCDGPLTGTKHCESTCRLDPVDCKFGAWSVWKGLDGDALCEDGDHQKVRSRDIAIRPEHGGASCSGPEKETEGCLPVLPLNCTLSNWTAWGDCSVSCGAGQQVRTRKILEAARFGGEPCIGRFEETESCQADDSRCPEQVDCQWADWTTWSACSCSCGGGQSTRDRIIKVSPTLNGKLCDIADKSAIGPCNTHSCDDDACVDGRWSSWSDYGKCSALCGGGLHWRDRSIVVEANICGTPAKGVDRAVQPCNQHSCGSANIDCQLSDWDHWSDCSCTIDGVKRRVRRIATYGTGTGKWCEGGLKEVGACNTCKELGSCTKPLNCTFSKWKNAPGDDGQCSVTCGAGQLVLARNIERNATDGGSCHGDLSKVGLCHLEDCPTPQPPEPCTWSEWFDWSACDKCGGQRKRTRQIKVSPSLFAEPCQPGAAEETEACPRACHEPKFCEWSVWEQEQSCSVSCGSGFLDKMRYLQPKGARRLLDITGAEMLNIAQCEGRQMKRFACNNGPCDGSCEPVDCELGDWAQWGACTCTGLSEHHRGVATRKNECGAPCEGPLVETKRCKAECLQESVDCEFKDWSDWMGASGEHGSEACQGHESHKLRKRSIAREAVYLGRHCEGKEIEAESCPEEENLSCKLSDWSKWTPCSATCGAGQVNRTRTILVNASRTGESCKGDLIETSPCEDRPCGPDQDCKWGEWVSWSACSCSCDGGQRTRDRIILHAPTGNGKLCDPETREEIADCNTQSCHLTVCVDGTWADWEKFGMCTATCGGGLRWRRRNMAKEANHCGHPASGIEKDVEPCSTQSCSPNVDCELGAWSEWADCSCTQDGVKRRNRRVETYGSGYGAWCDGNLKEVSSCNTCKELGTCDEKNKSVDCKYSDWYPSDGENATSPVTCGEGHVVENRTILQYAENQGAPCNVSTSRVRRIQLEECPILPQPKACAWSDWDNWGSCDKCGGQRQRARSIKAMPEKGGAPCKLGASGQIEKCPRKCHDVFYCAWSDWNSAADCSVTCGSGTRMKMRHLQAVTAPIEVLAEASHSLDLSDESRMQDMAFAFGFGAFVSLMAFLRVHPHLPWSRSREDPARTGDYSSFTLVPRQDMRNTSVVIRGL